MDDVAQKLYISSMLGNPALFARVQHLLQPSYFDGNFQPAVRFMKEFYQTQRGVPSLPVFYANTKLSLESVELPRQDIQYVAEQIAGFCQIRAVTEAVLKAPAYIEKGEFGAMVNEIKLASQVQLHSDLGIDYFENPIDRLEESESQEVLIPLGWPSVDDLIGGGVGRQELILLTANSGGGKSIAMLNIGFNMISRGMNGVYITLEMRDRVVAKRLDSIISRISGKEIFANKLKVGQDVELMKENSGRFFIKRMREGSTTADHIISYLRELEAVHGFKPDFVIVDYLDLMASVTKHSGDNMFTKDKYTTEEVRAIGFDFDCLMISASQLGRCLDIKTNVMLKTGGTKSLAELVVGEHILGNAGVVQVLAKTPIQRKKAFKVTLANGKTIICSSEHRFPSSRGTVSISSGLSVGDTLTCA